MRTNFYGTSMGVSCGSQTLSWDLNLEDFQLVTQTCYKKNFSVSLWVLNEKHSCFVKLVKWSEPNTEDQYTVLKQLGKLYSSFIAKPWDSKKKKGFINDINLPSFNWISIEKWRYKCIQLPQKYPHVLDEGRREHSDWLQSNIPHKCSVELTSVPCAGHMLHMESFSNPQWPLWRPLHKFLLWISLLNFSFLL